MIYSDANHILKELNEGTIKPVYILHGLESYYIDLIVHWIEKNILTEGEKAFNQVVTYGRDIEIKQIYDEARQFPMMSDRRVVIIKEAQDLKDLKLLDSYMSSPVNHTVLVIAHMNKKLDGRMSWMSTAKKSPHIVYFLSEPIKDYKLNGWLNGYMRSKGRKIDNQANQMLCEYLGTDLKKLVNEIEKIELNIAADKMIDAKDVERYVGISKDYNVFELIKALSHVDRPKAFFITDILVSNIKRNPIQMLLPNLFNHFQRILILSQMNARSEDKIAQTLKIPKFTVREYIAACQHYSPISLREILAYIADIDLKSKGVGNRQNDPGELMRDVIQRILYFAR